MRQTCPDGNTQEELLKINRAQKLARKKQEIKEIDAKLSAESKPFIEQARDKGASSWLNALPIEELNFVLNKEEFRDSDTISNWITCHPLVPAARNSMSTTH